MLIVGVGQQFGEVGCIHPEDGVQWFQSVSGCWTSSVKGWWPCERCFGY